MNDKLITVEDYNSVLMNFEDSVFYYHLKGSDIPEEYFDLPIGSKIKVDFLDLQKTNNRSWRITWANVNLYGLGIKDTPHTAYHEADDYIEYLALSNPPMKWGGLDVWIIFVFTDNIQLAVWRGIMKDIDCIYAHGFKGQLLKCLFKTDLNYNKPSMPIHINQASTDVYLAEKKKDVDEKWLYLFKKDGIDKNIHSIVGFRGSYTSAIEGIFKYNQFKSPNFLNITGELIVSKADNKLTIEPFIFDELNPIQCKLSYLDKEQTFELIQTQEINIDLKDKLDLKNLKLKVEIGEGELSNAETLEYSLQVKYNEISTFADLSFELDNVSGSKILYLTDDLEATENLYISHDVLIYGNNHSIILNGTNITVNDGITFKCFDTSFVEGDNAIVQKENSLVELNNCEFMECTSTVSGGLGSCIYCDIDLESLTIPNDFTTILKNTSFDNSYGAIFHSGELMVEDCTFRVDDFTIINPIAPYFLYQTDGTASINDSVFDMDLESVGYLCDNQVNADLSQCLFVVGENAILNNLSSIELQNDVNFFENYNNLSHIFMKYYYSEIGCVYISPTLNYEDRNLCYAISNIDYIFRKNVEITRADVQEENRINPLRRG